MHSKTVEIGTLSRTWTRTAPEMRIERGGNPAERRFPKPMISATAKTATGANIGPTEAISLPPSQTGTH